MFLKYRIHRLIAALLAAAFSRLIAADPANGLMPQRAVPFQHLIYSHSDHPVYTLGDIIMLLNKANSGNPFAQHELGLCYLTGRPFPADTVKAAYWIGKAAEKNLVLARYNMGILLNNGWGVPWNPYEAFRHFRFTAEHGMMEARYVYGLLFTDNLVVPRNDAEAFRWIALSADSGYAPAKETLAELIKRGFSSDSVEPPDSTKQQTVSAVTRIQPVSIDSVTDSDPMPDDENLLQDALSESNGGDGKTGAAALQWINETAAAGSPEALTLLGRRYETGWLAQKNPLLASLFYLRAIRNQSRWAPVFLWNLIKQNGYFDCLKAGVQSDDPVAKFVWAGLYTLGFDRQLTDVQALRFLKTSADQGCIDAVLELGLSAYSGRRVPQDRERARSLFRQAAAAGSQEAQIRLWMIAIGTESAVGADSLAAALHNASRIGSVHAQAALGYCYQKGIGIARNIPRAVYFYRKAARRGSEAAYNALREMYDAIRPVDSEFQIGE